MTEPAPTRLIIDHQGRREIFEVLEETLTIGREPTSGLHVDDQKVSRQHARIRLIGSTLQIEDLGSSNGTYVNGLPIFERTTLSLGDRVDIGSNVILWIGRAPDGAATTAPSAPQRQAPPKPAAAPAAPPPQQSDTPSVPRTAGSRAGRQSQSSRAPLIAGGAIAIIALVIIALQGGDHQEATPQGDAATTAEVTPAPGGDNEPATASGGPDAPAKNPGEESVDRAPQIPSGTAEEELARDFELALVDMRYKSAWRIVERIGSAQGSALKKRLQETMARAAADIEKEARAKGRRSAHAAAGYLKARLDAFPPESLVHTELTGLLLEFPTAPRKPDVVAKGDKTTTDPVRPGRTPTGSTESTPRPTVARAPSADVSKQAGGLVEAGEAAMKGGRYAEAEKQFEEAVAALAATDAGRLGRRAQRGLRRASAHLGFIEALVASAGKDPGALGRVPHLPGESGTVLRIDGTGLAFQSSDGPLPVAWRVLPKRAFLAIVKKAKLSPAALVDASVWLRSYGSDEDLHAEADTLLARAFRKQKNLRQRIEIALADARQMPLPERGFTLLGDEWLSPRQVARRRLNDIVDAAVKDVEGDDDAKREEAVTVLAGLGDAARSSLYRALLMRRAILKERLQEQKSVSAINQLGELRLELEKARENALELIFDTTKYPYPYRPPAASQAAFEQYRKHQPIIDQRTAAIRKIWDDQRTVAVPDSVHELIVQVRQINGLIEDSGFGEIAEDQNPHPWLMHLPASGTPLSIRTIALSGAERERIDRSTLVMARNEKDFGTATRGEVAQVRITNEYRMLMGRWAVRTYERLTRASHDHCKDMSEKGFFSHMSPIPGKRTPGDRAARAGMMPSGISENIAINSGPLGAHNAWIHSPGHHRNILGLSWRLMGPGNVGRHWCQNFSVADRAAPEEDSDDDSDDDSDEDK